MSLIDLIRRSARSLKSAKARTLLTAFAISVGTYALTLTLAASNGAQNFVNNTIADNFDPAELIIANDDSVLNGRSGDEPQEYDPDFTESSSNSGATIQVKKLTSEDIELIKNIDGVEYVRENIDLNFRYIKREGTKKFVATAQGKSPAQKFDLLAGEVAKDGPSKGGLILPEQFLEALEFEDADSAIGEEVTVAIQKPLSEDEIGEIIFKGGTQEDIARATQDSLEKKTFVIEAVRKKPTSSQPGTELYMYINQADVRKLDDIASKGTDDYQRYLYAFARVEGGEDPDKLEAVQNKIKDKGFVVQSVAETQEFLTQIIDILEGIVAAFGFIAVIASVFGIINTMYISVIQRTREIGLMKALGMRRRDIGRLFRFEAALIGLLGGLIGAAGALATGTALNPYINDALGLDSGDELLRFDYQQIIILILILIVISIIAGWLPSRKATKLDPIVALRTE